MVYHWTTRENAELILKSGLREGSWAARYPDGWYGDVCLEVDAKCDWQDDEWQAFAREHIPPELIRVYQEEI